MPRDNLCSQCGGMFHDDEIDEPLGVCVYCALGIDSGQEAQDGG